MSFSKHLLFTADWVCQLSFLLHTFSAFLAKIKCSVCGLVGLSMWHITTARQYTTVTLWMFGFSVGPLSWVGPPWQHSAGQAFVVSLFTWQGNDCFNAQFKLNTTFCLLQFNANKERHGWTSKAKENTSRDTLCFRFTRHAISFHPVGIIVQHRVESESLWTLRGCERTLVHRARPATE